MNWLLITLDIMFALVATILGILAHRTYKSIKHLEAGKSFWVPIFFSGIFFVFGSVVRIFHEFTIEYNWNLIGLNELIRVTELIAISIMFISIYNYSRTVKITIRAMNPKSKKEPEVTGLEKQAKDLLEQVEKLKVKQKK